MKSSILIIPLLLTMVLATINVSAQNQAAMQYMQGLAIQPNNTPEEYFRKADSVMNILYGTDSTESGTKSAYERYKVFFHSRSKPVFNNEHIAKAYVEALQYARTRGPGCGTEDDFKGNWKNIGPRTDNISYQNQGWVSSPVVCVLTNHTELK